MRRMAIAGVGLAVLLAINAAAASMASATKLVLSDGGVVLPPALNFKIYGTHNLSVTTSAGRMHCLESTAIGMEVSVLSNSKSKDELKVARLDGDPGPCNDGESNVAVFLNSVGGVLTLGANGKATAGGAAMLIDFERLRYKEREYADVDCRFFRKRLLGTNTATPSPQALKVELAGTLKLDPTQGSPDAKHLCPKKAEMTLSLPVTEDEAGEEEAIEEQQVP